MATIYKTYTYKAPKRIEAKATFPVDLHKKLQNRAIRNNHSMSRELIDIVEKALSQEEQELAR
jgi:hypothetical protein